MVHISEVTNLMDRMMNVNIFYPSEKLRMLRDEEKIFLDPNLVMDARHQIFKENLSASSTNDSILTEAKKLLMQEEAKQLYMKKQQQFLERELKKFEMELSKSRPKFSKYKICTRSNFASSDDEDFWKTGMKLKHTMTKQKRAVISSNYDGSINPSHKKNTMVETDDSSFKVEDEKNQQETECDVSCIGGIKVTITDKSNFEVETQRLCLLKKYFDILKQNVNEERYLRGIETRIQRNMILKITRKYFDIWRIRTKEGKATVQRQKEKQEISEEEKIEIFINTIIERQKKLTKYQKPRIQDDSTIVKESKNSNITKKSTYCKRIISESPAQCRLNAQKQIIEKQKAKLAEQSKIIEELKLKQMQEEISRANKETMDIAKNTLTNCGKNTRRTLVKLMQQNGYRDESLTIHRQPSDPPKFLLRMEARVEARRKRVKLAEEMRRQKLEEQKRKQEDCRIEEEQKKRRLQQEALAEARRVRKEQEYNRQRELEKLEKLNNIADQFYRKYLLRNYIMKPFVILIENLRNNTKKAEDHYREKLRKKIFIAWKKTVENQCKIKTDIADSFCSTNLMSRAFKEWRQATKEVNLKYQVAIDFSDMKLLDKFFRLWKVTTVELKINNEKKEKLVTDIYENKLKVRYLGIWKKYVAIATDIKESEKKRDELRQLVQKVIPDFNPKERGVALED